LGAKEDPLTIIKVIDPKNINLDHQNGPESLGTEKLLKILNCQKSVLGQLE
jgi:hypothetical protein